MASLTDTTIWESLKALVEYGSITSAARALGIPRSTLRRRLAVAALRYPGVIHAGVNQADWAKGLPLPEQPACTPLTEAASALPTYEERIVQARERNRIEELTERLKKTEQHVITLQDENSVLKQLKGLHLSGVPWVGSPQVMDRTTLVPLLFTSDFHVGEKIIAAELDGMNSYDMDIFASRYNTLIERTIDISEHHTGPSDFPGIFYLRGGDAISGQIHEELRETNDLSAIPAGKWLLRHEREGIKRLKAKFGRVRVISIPGNHGRHTLRPRASGYMTTNYETLLSWWLASMFDDDPNVTFYTPESGDAWFEVLGHAFLLSHGDRMGSRGGMGFVGPAATIARGHQKLYTSWSLTGKQVDYILTGHLHTSLKLEYGYGNGSLVGYSPFAQSIRAKPDAAKQWLLYVHAKRGVSLPFEIQVNDRPIRSVEP